MKKDFGFESVLAIKSNHSCLPKAEVETLMDDYPSGSHLVLSSKAEDETLYFVGYKYNSKKVLLFLCSENAGLFSDGKPYVAKFPDKNGNVQRRDVPRPTIVSDYFGVSNVVDRHNHLRQAELKLEKHWVTMNPWFRINTTGVGMTVTDAFLLARASSSNKKIKEMKLTAFADSLAWDLIHNKDKDVECNYIPPSSATLLSSPACQPANVINCCDSSSSSPISEVTLDPALERDKHKLVDIEEWDRNGERRLRRQCTICKKKKTHKICAHPMCQKGKYSVHLCSDNCLEVHRDRVCGIVGSGRES